jgi:acyl carrier protein
MKTLASNALREALLETFPTAAIPNFIDELKLGDLTDWDSLGNFYLLLALEKKFQIHFDIDEITNLRSIADIKSAIETKL